MPRGFVTGALKASALRRFKNAVREHRADPVGIGENALAPREYGTALAREVNGRVFEGLIPEAVRELIRRAFTELDLTTLWCGYFDGNEQSRRVQEKCGFRYHHTSRDIHWRAMDDIRTEHVTRLTREEWEAGTASETKDA